MNEMFAFGGAEPGPSFTRLTVIDATGAADTVAIRVQ
jgi:hypothetical protein